MEIFDTIPEELTGFEIIRKIDSGSMGAVYHARQESPCREVALKILSGWLGLTAQATANLKREIAAVARLKHPHIAQIDAHGEFGLSPYLVSELVEGPCLKRVIRHLKSAAESVKSPGKVSEAEENGTDRAVVPFLPVGPKVDGEQANIKGSTNEEPNRDRYDYMALRLAEIADALTVAHAARVVHHDIKPANLLVRPDGHWCISDFKIAKMLEQPGMTVSGFETALNYTAPEQVAAGWIPGDARTDIYSVGAVLYELLTLQPPFDGESRAAIIAKILHSDPIPPCKLAPEIPRDLETICLKAMQQDPAKRYQTAAELGKDLRNFASRSPIAARRQSFASQSARWSGRHKLICAGIVCALLASASLATWTWRAYDDYRIQAAATLDREFTQAIIAATSGDLQANARKIEEIEQLGADSWTANLLRGQCLLFAGEPTAALDEFETALRRQPESIPLKVLLESAYLQTGKQQAYDVLHQELAAAQPATVREKLFLAHWNTKVDLQKGIDLLLAAEHHVDSVTNILRRLFLAQARLKLLQDTRAPELLDDVLLDARIMNQFLNFNSYGRTIELQAQRISAAALRSMGEEARANEVDQQANETLAEIEKRFPNSHGLAVAWTWEACAVEEAAERLQALRRTVDILEKRKKSLPTGLRQAYLLDLVAHGEQLPEAAIELQKLRAEGETGFEFVLAVVMAEEHGVAEAEQELAQLPNATGPEALYRPLGLLTLGKSAEAETLYNELRETAFIPYEQEWHAQLFALGCGEKTIDDILAEFDPHTPVLSKKSQLHFFEAMRLFSEGRRQAAQSQFEECLKTGDWMSREYQTSRAVVEKWKHDATWPSWIPESNN